MSTKKKCNFCSKEFDEWDELSDFTIHKKIGYGSHYDGEEVCLRLCCDCFDRIVGGCMINPILGDD